MTQGLRVRVRVQFIVFINESEFVCVDSVESDNDRFPCEIRSRATKTNLYFLICIDSLRTKNFCHSSLMLKNTLLITISALILHRDIKLCLVRALFASFRSALVATEVFEKCLVCYKVEK